MSGRAAWRLESLGFKSVYRYHAGKQDWAAYGLPVEGKNAGLLSAGAVARRDVPTCHLDDKIGEVHQRTLAAGWKVCIVVNDEKVVLGRLRRDAWTATPETRVEEVMENGPTTFRPNRSAEALANHLKERKVETTLITNSDGVLIGVFYRRDVEERLGRG